MAQSLAKMRNVGGDPEKLSALDYEFTELVDLEQIQGVIDSFCEALGVASAIVDRNGVQVLKSNITRLCGHFHRGNPGTNVRCIESDTTMADQLMEGQEHVVYHCKNGLVDAAAPIYVDGEHVASFFIGQFFFEPPDLDHFRRQAEEFGFDVEEYMAAVAEIPVIEHGKIEKLLDFVSGFANVLGEMGFNQKEQLENNAELKRLQQEVLEAQQRVIQELSTPIIPVMDRIIVMPLVGSIDTMRAKDIMRALLSGISDHRASVVILDVTGVPIVDSGVASHMNKTIQAARLKGAHTIITGISDAVAETIVDLGIDWTEIETLSNLETGLQVALSSLGYRLTKER